MGAELNITFTNRDTKWNTTFKVAPRGENRQCFDPGSLHLYAGCAAAVGFHQRRADRERAGDNFAFPIYGE
ncbi:MAG: hypothetical protein R2851_09985 [Caldilineaceae bacterium]